MLRITFWFTLLASRICAAQSQLGVIGGVVSCGGLPGPGAQVTVTLESTQMKQPVIIQPGGKFLSQDLPPGTYLIVASASGCSEGMREAYRLRRKRQST